MQKKIEDISGFTHGVGWCAPQQGACKLSLNVKNGVIEEALIETIGCSGMTHSAAMAAEVLQGKTILEALNTDLVCDANQYSNERTVPSDRFTDVLRVLSLMTVLLLVQVLRTLVKAFVPRLVQCTLPGKRSSLPGNGRGLCNRYCS